mmetsp:Transcript_816/g.1417  ORF Transcript_816/g.1417 Transcript_816/m.1417 type:complete len:262 (+) Transcript_816:197-982(+)
MPQVNRLARLSEFVAQIVDGDESGVIVDPALHEVEHDVLLLDALHVEEPVEFLRAAEEERAGELELFPPLIVNGWAGKDLGALLPREGERRHDGTSHDCLGQVLDHRDPRDEDNDGRVKLGNLAEQSEARPVEGLLANEKHYSDQGRDGNLSQEGGRGDDACPQGEGHRYAGQPLAAAALDVHEGLSDQRTPAHSSGEPAEEVTEALAAALLARAPPPPVLDHAVHELERQKTLNQTNRSHGESVGEDDAERLKGEGNRGN